MGTEQNPKHLFIYGTLHPDRAPSEIADVVRNMKPVGRATIRGVRYELDSFPAVIIDAKAGEVAGEVYVLPNDADSLKRLDEYEEYYPQNLSASLFRREQTSAEFQDGSHKDCWIYVYNQPISVNLKESRAAVA
jgi:gamma-glutamylcyclotransferase (GGCT)/AIG2-like uncharacterized protein YtfP